MPEKLAEDNDNANHELSGQNDTDLEIRGTVKLTASSAYLLCAVREKRQSIICIWVL